MSRRWMGYAFALAALAVLVAACAPELPREWRERVYGPDPTPTSLLRNVPTPLPGTSLVAMPTPPPANTPLLTLTAVPSRTPTVTRTATATPAVASLTLRQDTPWFMAGAFVPYQGAEDTFISAWSRTSNFADAPVLSVRQGDIMGALLYFHLGDLPASTPVYNAEIGIYVSSRSNDTPMKLTVRSLLKPWLLGEATWQDANKSLPWQTPGAGGDTDRAAAPVAELTAGERGAWLTFDVTELVQQWIKQPQANQGLIINGEAPLSVQYDFTSANSADTRHRPYLQLTFPTGAIAVGPVKAPTATPSATPVVDPLRPESVNLLRFLPQDSTVVARATGRFADSASPVIVAAVRPALGQGVRIGVFRYYGGQLGDYRLDWTSQELPGSSPVSLELLDLTGDGEPELLVGVSNPAATGRMLYVFTRLPSGYRMVAPIGGYFDGKNHFGETGYELADSNGDGRLEIIARHGSQTDMYAWDGANLALAK